MTVGSGKYRQQYTDTIRYLVIKPRTVRELAEMAGCTLETASGYLNQLEAGGLAYRERPEQATEWNMKHFQKPDVWHWCPVPFETPETAKKAA